MSAAAFDLGSVQQASDGSFVFQLDSGIALQQPAPNVFVAQGISGSSGGLGGICFVPGLQGLCDQTQTAAVLDAFYLIPGQGFITFSFPAQNTIQGVMDMIGFAYANPNLQGRYQGQFTGTLIGTAAC